MEEEGIRVCSEEERQVGNGKEIQGCEVEDVERNSNVILRKCCEIGL